MLTIRLDELPATIRPDTVTVHATVRVDDAVVPLVLLLINKHNELFTGYRRIFGEYLEFWQCRFLLTYDDTDVLREVAYRNHAGAWCVLDVGKPLEGSTDNVCIV